VAYVKGFKFSYGLDGDSSWVAFDYPMDTVTNTPTQGDAVKLVAGKLQKATPTDTNILGLMQSTVFEGYKVAAKIGQVAEDEDMVWQVPYFGATKTSLTDADIGTVFDLKDSRTLNLDVTTVGQFRIHKYDNLKKVAYVQLNKAARVFQ
jgi:hypothetical protein